MTSKLEELIMISDILDVSGLKVEADIMDDIIKVVAQSDTPRASHNFWDGLRKRIEQEVSNPDSPISDKVLQRLDDIASDVLKGDQLEPFSERIAPGSEQDVIGSITALAENIMEIDRILEQPISDQQRDHLEKQRDQYLERLNGLHERVDRMLSGGGRQGQQDVEMAQRIRQRLQEIESKLKPTREDRFNKRVQNWMERSQEGV